MSLAFISCVTVCQGQGEELPVFVGKSVCLDCHGEQGKVRPCLVEPIAGHERSYDLLQKPEAEHIAWLSGVPEPPAENRVCLECHATSGDEGPRWRAETFDITDSVQCEACHGAGSVHIRIARRLLEQRKLPPELRPEPPDPRRFIRQGHHEQCVACHRDRDSHRMVMRLGYRKQTADGRYKTPTNLAVSSDGRWLYVVCSQSGSLIIVDTSQRRVASEIAVGSQPHDVAVSPDGRKLYVTNREDDTVSVIDVESRTVTATVPVGDEPHGVSTEPTGRFIFVSNTAQDSISVIDADALTEVNCLAAGRGPWALALSPDGKRAYAGSILPHIPRYQDPHHSEITILDTERRRVIDRRQVPGANMMRDVAFVPGRNVALVTLMRTKNLVPVTRLMQGWTITNGLGIVWPDGRIDQVLLDEQDDYFPDPTGVAVSPDARFALVAGGGSNQLAVVDLAAMFKLITQASDRERRDVLPNHLGMSRRFVVKRIDVGANPRGVVFSPDGTAAYVADALDDTVTVIDTADFTPAGRIDLGGPKEITAVRWGQQLFHDAANAYGRQFSCRSCHPDGHVNGLTFDIEPDGVGFAPVDNRTLRGIVDTNPFKWEGTNPSLRRQCGPRLAVFFTRLHPYTPEQLEAVTQYMCTIPRPPNRYRRPDGLTPAQRRGKLVFQRVQTNTGKPIPLELRCDTCHAGAYGNDTRPRGVGTTMWLDTPVDFSVADLHDAAAYFNLGVYYFHDTGTGTKEFDVPHLNNIYDSAPYLHNGSAVSLEAIWTRFNSWDEHGVTNDLTRRQLNDLITYLKAR